ncbi:MAG: dynamin family protein [Treponema sp.]|nr:dynamin family protein [Treponema sp.]
MDINRMIQIAQDVGMEDVAQSLCDAQNRLQDGNVPLILPLVGEFSAGKTTLINSLTDCKQLETATKPTTATIYQIFFGKEECKATVVYADGREEVFTDISQLKNDTIKDASVVLVEDTSTKVPSTTVLVDTPGLSSPDENHRRVLMDFLPSADGVLLTVDVNQQVTRSLTDFAKDMELAKRRLYLVITKSDTKSPEDVDAARKYIAENCKLPLSQVACVSAANGDVQELFDMLNAISNDKSKIVADVTAQRVESLSKRLVEGIDELLAVQNPDSELADKIKAQEKELDRLNRNIDRLVDDTQDGIKEIERSVNQEFCDTIFNKLDALAASHGIDFDTQARMSIGGTVTLYLNEYKNRIQNLMYQNARERRSGEDGINLRSLEELDYSGLNISDIPYNMNLNTVGHEYDGILSGGAKILSAAALVAGTIATAGALGVGAAAGAGAAGAGAAGAGAAAGTGGSALLTGLAGSADAIAVGAVSIAAQQNNKRQIQQIMQNAPQQFSDSLNTVNNFNQQAGNQLAQKKNGLVEGLVSRITDKASKPKRQKAVNDYISDTLVPAFENEMRRVSNELLTVIRNSLHTEAQGTISQKEQALETLKAQLEQSRSAYEAQMKKIKSYKQELLTR